MLVTLIGLIIAVSGCSLDVPGPPIWTIEVTVPFSKQTYRLADLVSDSADFAENGWGLFINGEDSVLSFKYEDNIESQQVGDRLTYDESGVGSYANEIGLIVIEEPLPDADSILISDAIPNLFPGYFGIVPSFPLEQAADTLVFNIFSWVRVNDGNMLLTIRNGYPFGLTELIISLYNLSSGEDIGQAVFPDTIGRGEEAEGIVDLTGRLVENQILMQADGRSVSTAPDSVEINGDENLVIFVGISETSVDSANAEVATQEFTQADSIVIEDDNKIQEAIIKSGTTYFRLSNTTKFELIVDMTFENILSETGEPLSQRIEMPPESRNVLYEMDLAGKVIRMDIDSQNLNVVNHVTVVDTRETNYQGTSYQTIAGYQGVNIDYWTSELVLSSLSGILNKIEVEFPMESTVVDLPSGLENLNFTSDTLFINLTNKTSMPVELILNIAASNSTTGEEFVLPVQVELEPGPNKRVVLDVDRLTEVIPDMITVSGEAHMGIFYFPDWADRVGTITADDGFFGDIRLKSDLRLTIGFMEMITEATELDSALDYPIENISIRVQLQNTIPLGGYVKILMGHDTLALDTLFQVPIPSGPIINHRIELAETTFTIDLGPAQLDIMRELPLYTQQAILLFGTGNDTINLSKNDTLSVRAWATVFYTINPNEKDEDK